MPLPCRSSPVSGAASASRPPTLIPIVLLVVPTRPVVVTTRPVVVTTRPVVVATRPVVVAPRSFVWPVPVVRPLVPPSRSLLRSIPGGLLPTRSWFVARRSSRSLPRSVMSVIFRVCSVFVFVFVASWRFMFIRLVFCLRPRLVLIIIVVIWLWALFVRSVCPFWRFLVRFLYRFNFVRARPFTFPSSDGFNVYFAAWRGATSTRGRVVRITGRTRAACARYFRTRTRSCLPFVDLFDFLLLYRTQPPDTVNFVDGFIVVSFVFWHATFRSFLWCVRLYRWGCRWWS